jgi:ABC-type sulfate transport system permease subunit
VPYSNEIAPAGTVASVKVGSTTIASFEGARLEPGDFSTQSAAFGKQLGDALKAAGYPAKADPAAVNAPMLLVLLTILVLYVTMVYGPIAAWLVELFPTRIRYSSMSLPYHIGNGWFGGFLPTVSFALVAWKGDIYYGLWYTIIVSLMTLVVGTLFLRETNGVDISR